MASSRQILTLGDLGPIKTGKTPSTKVPEHFGGKIHFVTPRDMDGRKRIVGTVRYVTEKGARAVGSAVIPAGSIMVSCIGSDMSKVAIAGRECVTNQQIKSIVVAEEYASEYVYYDLSQRKSELRSMASGSAQPILNKGHFSQVTIEIPDFPQQRTIAHILGSLDDKIELNRRMNQTLEATARAIFKSWFVDFDPVRAKQRARTQTGDPVRARRGEPLCSPNPGMPDDIAELFPDSFENSELGEIPKGWEVGVVADLGNVICGKTSPTKDPENYGEDIPFITIPDMHGKVFITQTGKYLSTKGANTQRNKYLPAKSICVSCIATPGLVVMTTERSQTNQQINSIIQKNKASSYYCYQVLNRLGDQIRAGGSGGSVLLNLNKTLFSNIKILMPDEKIIKSYQWVVEPFFKEFCKINVNQLPYHLSATPFFPDSFPAS